MSYQPFLIAPFSVGLDTDMAPWQLPQDSFSDVVNGHIHHGVIEKREGFSKQGDIVHQDQTNWKITGVTAADPGVVSVTSATGISNGDIVEIRNVVGMTQLNGNQYTVAGVGGTSFQLQNTDTTNFTAWSSLGDVYVIPQDRAMGIDIYIDSSGGKEVLAFNTKRACKFNSTIGNYNPLDSADIMSGSDTDYVWTANWASTSSSTANTLYRMYFTNGKALSGGLDGIRYYDGGSTTLPFNPTINSGVTINGCKLVFAFNQRLVLLHTFEGANTFPQRARWSQAQKPGNSGAFTDEWDDNTPGKGGFFDAPTGDHIISAQFVQNALIVFFTNSVWTLQVNPGDPSLPFRWTKINDFRGCDGKMTTEQFDRNVIASSVRGITATDGVQTQRIDQRIDEFVTEEINDASFNKVFTKRSYANHRMWMLYAGGLPEATDADAALIFDEESSAFSKYEIGMNVLGTGSIALDSKIDDYGDKTIEEFDEDTLRSYFFDDVSDILLGGNTTGEIFLMEQGGTDNEKIYFSPIVNVSQANPAVVRMDDDLGIVNGDIITISGIATGSMVELNGRQFVVASKSGNEFALTGEDSSGYAAYVANSDGTVGQTDGDAIEFSLTSAAWNPWMTEGKQSQLGYVDLFLETNRTARMEVEFYTNNGNSRYAVKTINLLPELGERGEISGITNASPGQVTASLHGLITGNVIYIYGVEGMDGVNGGPYTVTMIDANNFTIGIDTTNYGTYTNFGVLTDLPYASTKSWKRIYAGGTGYQHVMKIKSSGKNEPIKIHAFMPWFKPRGRAIG